MSGAIKLSSPETHQFWEIPVLHEDADLLALDKPAGFALSADAENPAQPSLMKLLHAGIAEAKPWASGRALSYLNNVNAPDAEASGVLLLAKSKEAFTRLADVFGAANQPVRKYLALVHGAPKEARFEVNAKLGPNPARPGMMIVDPHNGKKSQTVFEVIETFAKHTLMSCQPLTERMHQVRVHLQNSGLRVVGDALYGGKPLLLSQLKGEYRLKPGREERPLIGQPAVQVEQLTFPHPSTGVTTSVTAPLPKDLKVALKYLRLYAK